MVRQTRKGGGWWSKKTQLSTKELIDDLDHGVPTNQTPKKCTWLQKFLRGCDEEVKLIDVLGHVKENSCPWYKKLVGRCPKSRSGGSQRNRRSRRKRRR
jgi:hypothetical protein